MWSDPLSCRTTFTYDKTGRKSERLDADGDRTTYQYDSVGRLERIDYPLTYATMTYDAVGNMIGLLDAQGYLSMT